MNKAEFKIYLTSKYNRVGNLRIAVGQADFDIRKAEMGYSFYAINVDDLITDDSSNEISTTATIKFKVYDEGAPQERVVWDEKADPTFQQRPVDEAVKILLTTWYKNNKPVEIHRFQITSVDIELQFAIANVYELVNGVIVEGKVFIQKNSNVITAIKMG